MSNIKDYSDDNSLEVLEEYISEIITVTEGKENELFRTKSILKIMDYLSNKNSWSKVIDWAKLINPAYLDTKPFEGVSSDGKRFRKPSDKESYFLKLSKALEKEEKWQECIDLCNNALIIFPDELWFSWHKASCLRKLKKFKEAISLLEEIKKLKQDWFILKDLSAAYYENKQFDAAFNNFIDAAVSQIKIPEPANRWELFYIGARLLYKQNNIEMADKHIALTFKLREEKGWKIPDFLQTDVYRRKIDIKKTSLELFNELKDFWIREQQNSLPKQTGRIKNLFQNDKAGFIAGQDGKSYYFKANSFLDNKSRLKVNCHVQFNIKKSFDKKKNRESEEAINISIIQ
ncbi:hypothetical protein [Ignavibacterium sp.]|uniref:tetratricopeptide repeat protein n=1 Tax=Ignavibacterium sp. TaxID=2651167 RepID=UPI0026382D1A|nr:hypothetical protein [Ignavibacterium sp.]